jgi:hypothetical protein
MNEEARRKFLERFGIEENPNPLHLQQKQLPTPLDKLKEELKKRLQHAGP